MEIDIREEADTIRFADGGRNENNVYIQDYDGFQLAVVRDSDGKEAEIEAENIGNLIKALEQVKEYFGDGPGEEDGPWADGWEKRAGDTCYVSMRMNARDFQEVPPVKFRWNPTPELEIGDRVILPDGRNDVVEEFHDDSGTRVRGGGWYCATELKKMDDSTKKSDWIRHDGGDCPVHPMDIVEIINDLGGKGVGALPAEKFLWAGVDFYRHKKDSDGIPYCADEELEPWAEYVATDEDGDVNQYSGYPTDKVVYSMWWPDVNDRIKEAPRRYSNTSQHWTETLRRVWRK